LLALSLAHAGGLAVVVRCLIARRPIVLLDGDFDAQRCARLLDRVTLASLVPTQLAALLDDPAWRPPPSLRAVLLGGAAAPPALIEAARARGVPVLATYGATETFGQVATARTPGGPLVALPGIAISTHADRITIRGPTLAARYLDGEPIAPAFVTADLGAYDAATRIVTVHGRRDDVIISGGENIHPAEIEAVLAATPGVRAAVAFGVADARWGQLVAAAIAVDPRFDAAAAAARWHDALPAHARPRRLAIATALPVGPTGKLDRRAAAALPATDVRYGA
jgi:O-succinylbenzoic acid--CoA ligase